MYSTLHKSISGNGNVAPAPVRLNSRSAFGGSGAWALASAAPTAAARIARTAIAQRFMGVLGARFIYE